MLMVVVPLAARVAHVSAAVAVLFKFWKFNVVAELLKVSVLTFSVAPKPATLTPKLVPFVMVMEFVLVVAVEMFTWPPLTVTPPVKVLGPVKLQVPGPEKVRDVVIVLLLSTTLPDMIPSPAPCKVNPRVRFIIFFKVPPSTRVPASDWI